MKLLQGLITGAVLGAIMLHAQAAQEPIRIGLVAPFSGPMAD
jgi:hypothetical protein